MGWRGTLVLLALVTIVGTYLWFAEAPPAATDGEGQQKGADSVKALRKLLVFEPADVVDLQLQRGSQVHRVKRQNGTWQGTEDPSVINDFLHTLADLRVLLDITESASAEELADYGLTAPLGVIILHVSGQTTPLLLQIGERNPATTGVYVRIGENGTIVLAGALVEWEFDQLFKRLSAGT